MLVNQNISIRYVIFFPTKNFLKNFTFSFDMHGVFAYNQDSPREKDL